MAMLQFKVKRLHNVELWNAKGLPTTVKLYPSEDLEIACELTRHRSGKR